MTRARRTAHRIRVWILIAGIVYTLAALAWLFLPFLNDVLFDDEFQAYGILGTPFAWDRLGDEDEFEYAANVLLVLGVLVLAQWAFLRPARGWTAQVTTIGRPLKSAVFAAALMAMLLTIGALALLLELPDWWKPIMGGTNEQPTAGGWGIVGIWTGMLLAWGLWMWVFFVYWRQGDRYTAMGKVIRGLVAGSFLEIFVAVPVHVWAARQRECYCCRGTYTTLIFAGAVLLWAFGPGIVLLYKREAYRREKLLHGQAIACPGCGYDLRGNESGVCPECGEAI